MINNQNNINNNMMMNNNIPQMNMIDAQNIQQQVMMQQMAQQQMMMQQMAQKQMYEPNRNIEDITIKFIKNGKLVTKIKMSNNDMVAELIDEYLKKTKANISTATFKFRGYNLSPTDTCSLYEVGLINDSEIIVT